MAKLSVAIIVASLMIVFVTAGGEKKSIEKRDALKIVSSIDFFQWVCQFNQNGLISCASNTATTTKGTPSTTTTPPRGGQTGGGRPSPSNRPSTPTEGSSTEQPSSTPFVPTMSTSSSTPSTIERAHWCQYAANGSWIPFNYTFMHAPCVMCHCGVDRELSCYQLQCMDLHCIDGQAPRNITGQCCPQCAYETAPTSCRMGDFTFPHGTHITTVESNVECWCQSGTIECRKVVTPSTTTAKPAPISVLYTSDSYLPTGTSAYIVIIIICLILLLGTLLCCGCGLAYYYYYHNQQQDLQQAYEQYYNSAGWQPMGADGQVDGVVVAEDKQAEAAAAAHYPTDQSPEYIPPPYAVHNGPYTPKSQGPRQA